MSDDSIKRSDAIRAVSKVDDYGDGIGFEVKSHCLVELELVPSADRPKGKWIPYLPEGLRYKCSECESKYDTPWHFCPNCGSYNGGEQDE